MGLKLSKLVVKHQIKLESLRGRIIAIDAYNALYQFLALIRLRYGVPLTDKYGRVTSHLNGLLFRTVRLVEAGIRPVYVYDGSPPQLKSKTLEERVEKKKEAEVKWKEAVAKGDLRDAWAKAVQTSRLTKSMAEDSKKLLNYMGIPWVQAPSEGEAQAAYMTQAGDVWASASQDYDSLLFGSLRLVRNLTITGKKFLRKTPGYYKLKPELIKLDETLRELDLTREQLVDMCILMGTDYNEGVKGIGPVKAYKLIKKYGTLERVLEGESISLGADIDAIRNIFLNPPATADYELKWEDVDEDGLIEFLVEERGFQRERVKKAIERLRRARIKGKQSTLEFY
ncbi:MAG: flap endonuclease-1 [Thermoproteota archaeon]|nr:MAG: flap endonuclease-1 [Candidatus Korarchaeota archaeon]